MADQLTQVLGIVAIKNMGEYNSQTNYEKLNVVTYEGSSYCAKQNCKGVLPTNPDYWQLYAEKGDKGDIGPEGPMPVKGVDYYTQEDKSELELSLKVDVTEEVAEQLSGLTSATPSVVSSMSSMTDTSKIYVLSSTGHWFWNNGTNWVDGGVYQASQSTDIVENIEKYLKEHNKKFLMDWVAGDHNAATVTPSTKRVINENIQVFDCDLYIVFNPTFQYGLWTYDDELGTNPHWHKWVASFNRSYVIPKGTYFRILGAYRDATSSPTITDPYSSLIYENLEVYKYEDYQSFIINNYNLVYDNNLKYYLKFVIGDIGPGKVVLDTDANHIRRIVTKDIICLDFDLLIPKNNDNKSTIYLVTYADGIEDNYTKIGWINKNLDYMIPKGTYFRLLVSANNSDATAPVINIFTSTIFNNLYLYKYDKNANYLQSYVMKNNLIDSVAHQGYSGTDAINHSLLEGYPRAKDHGFNYGETDLKFTSDEIPVCCHDASFISNGETIIIANHTLAELKTYNYYGGTIASFEEVLAKCKEIGLGLYIDHLYVLYNNDTRFNTVFSIIKRYAMEDNVKWLISQNPANARYYANKILTFYKKSKLLIVTDYTDLSNMVSLANELKTDFNEIGIDFNYSNVSELDLINYNSQLSAGVKFEAWTIDNINAYKQYLPYVAGITSNKFSTLDL